MDLYYTVVYVVLYNNCGENMALNLQSGESQTTMTIKRKTLTSFQFLKLATGRTHIQFLEEIGNCLDVINSKYFENVILKKQKLNVEVRRTGSQITISIIPKLAVKTKNSKPITARFSKEGKFKGVVEK